MGYWQDQTVRIDSEAAVDVAPDGNVHLTWVEDGVSFTLIVPPTELERAADAARAKARELAQA